MNRVNISGKEENDTLAMMHRATRKMANNLNIVSGLIDDENVKRK